MDSKRAQDAPHPNDVVDPSEYTYTHLNELTIEDLARLGSMVVRSVKVAEMMGHVSLQSGAMYYASDEDPMVQLYTDYLRWTTFGGDEASRARLLALADRLGIGQQIADDVTR